MRAGPHGWRCGSRLTTSTSAVTTRWPPRGWHGGARSCEIASRAPSWATSPLLDADIALLARSDPATAERLAREALELARDIGDVGVEVVALAVLGSALVASGAVSEGLQRLEECAAMAVGEEFAETAAPGWALCHTVSACADVGDFGRAAQWCRALHTWSAVWQARHFFGVCRMAYGEVLATSGDWSSAEQELLSAMDDLRATRPGVSLRRRPSGSAGCASGRVTWSRRGRSSRRRSRCRRPSSPSASWTSRAATRRRRPTRPTECCGDWEMRASSTGFRPWSSWRAPARPRVTGMVRRRRPPSWRARPIGSPRRTCAGALAWCADASCRLPATTTAPAGPPRMPPISSRSRSAPYEAADARLLLSSALEALGRPERAEAEARAAREAFALLNASAREHRRATEELTPREADILRLVAQGLGDAQIAERLFLSPHTVHRHIANVRTKLDVPSRAAAVAHATRDGSALAGTGRFRPSRRMAGSGEDGVRGSA